MHGLLGGAFNCNVDFDEFQKQYSSKYSVELLTFVLEYLTTNFWPENGFMPEYNICDTDCEKGDADCGCTCNIDAMSISADKVRFTHVFCKLIKGIATPLGDYVRCRDTHKVQLRSQ